MPFTVAPPFTLELQQLAHHRALQAGDAGDAVAHLHHRADVHRLDLGLELLDLLP